MLSRHQEETQGRAPRSTIAFLLFLSSQGVLAGEASYRSSEHSATAPPFVLNTQHERISLDATDASLKAIGEQLERELAIYGEASGGECRLWPAALELRSQVRADRYTVEISLRCGRRGCMG